MYRKLPDGWRTTPEDNYSDVYMWEQFLSHSDVGLRLRERFQ